MTIAEAKESLRDAGHPVR